MKTVLRLIVLLMVLISSYAHAANTYSNVAGISISDGVNAVPYPSVINVPVAGNITDVSVTITNYSHSAPDDTEILLVGPTGETCLLLNDINTASGISVVFDDSAAGSLVNGSPTGTYQPSGNNATEDFPAGPYGLTLASFNGTNANGAWSLYVLDDLGNTADGTIASWSLTITISPGFTKVFAPDTIVTGGTSTLTFTIDNTVEAANATGLDFTDNLPAGLEIANPANAAVTCTGGTLTAVLGGSVITYTGGTVNASATCTITVDVTSTTAGNYVNTTGNLTSSLGNSGTATDTLAVNAAATIPTLSEWGMIVFSVLLGAIAIWMLNRRNNCTGMV